MMLRYIFFILSLSVTSGLRLMNNDDAKNLPETDMTENNGVKRTWDPNRKMFYLHIPKAAGISFVRDIEQVKPPTFQNIESREGCYDDTDDQKDKDVLIMLREPRAHTLSQYFHCMTAQPKFRGIESLPSSFEEWVNKWANLQSQNQTGGFCCYNPVDSQAFSLTCQAHSQNAMHHHRDHTEANVNIEQAIENMQKAKFVGLVEAYSESLCMAYARMHGVLPSHCQCTGDSALEEFPGIHHVAHGSAHHSLSDYSEDLLRKVDSIRSGDHRLYTAAVKRFVNDIRLLEGEFGAKVLCRDLDSSSSPEKFCEETHEEKSGDVPFQVDERSPGDLLLDQEGHPHKCEAIYSR